MCGRYLYYDGKNETIREYLARARRILGDETFARISVFDVFPGCEIFAGIHDERGYRSVIMKWGLRMQKKTVINARCETLMRSSFFRDTKPCVLMCSGYYEWSSSPRRRFLFSLADEKPMYLAGVYRMEKDGPRFVILTEPAENECAEIHPREPVVLSYENAQTWCRTMAMPVQSASIHERIIRDASE